MLATSLYINDTTFLLMKSSLSLKKFNLALVLVAAAIFGSIISIQEQNDLAFATFVPLEPLEPRPDSTDDFQEAEDEGAQEGKEKKEKKEKKDKKGGNDEDLPNTEDFVPVIISGNNVYLTWWSNKTGNNEVLFRASTDGGQVFGDKINLSNTTNAESVDVEIAAEGNNVVVTWWERNQTVNEPVVRISNDGGQTFGETLRLATNGTIGNNSK